MRKQGISPERVQLNAACMQQASIVFNFFNLAFDNRAAPQTAAGKSFASHLGSGH